MNRFERIVLTGGGTGGHLFPGLAVAQSIRERAPECQILFVGSERGVEQRIIKEAGFAHQALPIRSSAELKRAPISFALAYWKSSRIAKQFLREFAPQAVVGLGGFASVPVVKAAQKRKIPTVLLEQNIVPGRATRWLMKRANRVCQAFEQAREDDPRHIVTGNPVRKEIAALIANSLSEASRQVRTILILGGSQGARSLNRLWLETARTLRSELSGCSLFHQTGHDDCEMVRETYQELGLSTISEPFFEVLPTLYRQSDLAISRAGATTLAELACAGIPAVLVPYPNSLGDHQWKNARFFADRNAARVVEESGSTLTETVRQFLKADLLPWRQAMQTLAQPAATSRVVEVLEELL